MKRRALLFALPLPLAAADLDPKTVAAFEAYMRSTDEQMARRAKGEAPFLLIDSNPARLKQVQSGQLDISPTRKEPTSDVPDGLIHDWTGSVFVRGGTAKQALDVLTDFDRHKSMYAPDVSASKLISKNNGEYRSHLRFVKHKVITVTMNAEFTTRYVQINDARWQGVVRSVRIAEVDDAGTPQEKEKPVDTGWGFLWRLNSYWEIDQRDGGVYLELRSISLTRGIPFLLNTIIKPMVTGLPKESLMSTLEKTAKAIKASPR